MAEVLLSSRSGSAARKAIGVPEDVEPNSPARSLNSCRSYATPRLRGEPDHPMTKGTGPGGRVAKYVLAYAGASNLAEGRVRAWISYMITAGMLERATTETTNGNLR